MVNELSSPTQVRRSSVTLCLQCRIVYCSDGAPHPFDSLNPTFLFSSKNRWNALIVINRFENWSLVTTQSGWILCNPNKHREELPSNGIPCLWMGLFTPAKSISTSFDQSPICLSKRGEMNTWKRREEHMYNENLWWASEKLRETNFPSFGTSPNCSRWRWTVIYGLHKSCFLIYQLKLHDIFSSSAISKFAKLSSAISFLQTLFLHKMSEYYKSLQQQRPSFLKLI